MLRQQLVAIIAAQPGIGIREIKAQFPGVTSTRLHNALYDLRKAKAVEIGDRCGRYRVPERRPSTVGAGQIVPLSRLMAGR